MKPNCRFEDIAEVLRTRERFLVLSHVHPDGDALGSTLAMGLCLQQLGKKATLWNEDGVPEKFRYLPKHELISKPPAEPQDFDAVLVLDTAVQSRAGTCLAAVRQAGLWINIDHHVSNDHYGDLAYIDAAAPATGQILHELFKTQGLPITYEMADNLFAAISTDTGAFRYPSTSARTYEIGAELIRLGVKVGQLSQKMYESYPRRRLELLRALLNALHFGTGNRSVSFSLSLATAQALHVQPDDTEGLIDTIRAVEGVVVAAFFEELPEGKVRISLRSKDPRADVCKICAQFGGGGHTLASGARIRGSLAEVEKKVRDAIDQEIAAANL